MTDSTAETSPRLRARIAGGLYLMVIIAGSAALSVRSGAIVRGDAAATAANIAASEPLFRLGIAADLIAGACYIAVIAILYGLLKPVSRTVSLLAACFGLAGCIIGAALQLCYLAPLVLLEAAPGPAAAGVDQLRAQALIWLDLGGEGTGISFFFFGCYCLMLGYLVWRSAFLPRVLGALLALAGLAWLTGSLAMIVSPAFADSLSLYPLAAGGLGEGAFTLWLLVMGVNEAKWRQQPDIRLAQRTDDEVRATHDR